MSFSCSEGGVASLPVIIVKGGLATVPISFSEGGVAKSNTTILNHFISQL